MIAYSTLRRVIALTVILLLIAGCKFYNAGKQVRTVATMQGICALIEQKKDEHRSIDEVGIRMLAKQVAGGRDGWGNEILVATRNTPHGLSYLLISMGSDGQLDVSTPRLYFAKTPADVRIDTTRDIVFVDGKQVTNAGK